MKVVTSGWQYLDIDAYAGCVAYAELLKLMGEDAIAASSAPLNESITPTIRDWKVEIDRNFQPTSDDEFILVDISNPEFFDRFVKLERVGGVIDHHMEFAEYWRSELGERAQIEFIGAACTLIAERWITAGKLNFISETSARLLMSGIIDNTLNFRASVSTHRDEQAYETLEPLANLGKDWPAQYFSECQRRLQTNLSGALKNDTKQMEFPTLGKPILVSQLVLWNAEPVVRGNSQELRSLMPAEGSNWFINIASIAEHKNYLLASSDEVKAFIEQLLGAIFRDGIGQTDRLWLRKEIMKKDLDGSK